MTISRVVSHYPERKSNPADRTLYSRPNKEEMVNLGSHTSAKKPRLISSARRLPFKPNLNMNDVMISNLVLVNNYNMPTSTRSTKTPKDLFLSSLTTGLNKLGSGNSQRKNLGKSVAIKPSKLHKKPKSTSKPRKLSQKRLAVEQVNQPRLSQRLFSAKSHMDFFTNSQSNLPVYSSTMKKPTFEASVPLSKDMQTLVKRIKTKSVQKKPHSSLHPCEFQEKSTSSRGKKQLIKFKFEPKVKQGLLDPEFLSSDNKYRFSKLSPRNNFGSLLKKLKLTCQKSDY